MNSRGLLLTAGVIGGFLAIFIPLANRIRSRQTEAVDYARMRQIYVALSLYETDHFGHSAPNLSSVRIDAEPTDFASINDPNVGKSASYPVDPAVPGIGPTVSYRVSWSYRRDWPREISKPEKLDPRDGLLASWWTGSIDAKSPDGRGSTGPRIGINVDGSYNRRDRTDRSKLTFDDLFGR